MHLQNRPSLIAFDMAARQHTVALLLMSHFMSCSFRRPENLEILLDDFGLLVRARQR